MTIVTREQCETVLKQHKQEHLLSFFDELDSDGQNALLVDITGTDFSRSIVAFDETSKAAVTETEIAPIPDDMYIRIKDALEEKKKSYWQIGLKAIAEGTVAVTVLAGGQATRLGASVPKGLLPLGLHVTKSDNLLSLQAAQIAKLQNLASKEYPEIVKQKGGKITWMVMVSEATNSATVQGLKVIKEEHGLTDEQVIVFKQLTMPCFDYEGKILLSEKFELATAPDGNGGFFRAIAPCLRKVLGPKGIKYFHVYCVDNILCKVADPTFIGLSIDKNVQISAKVVEKKDPHEAVGVICKHTDTGNFGVVEYSEISKEMAEQRDAHGELAFRAGNIANHFFTFDVLIKASSARSVYHRANKKIPYVDLNSGEKVKPSAPNGVKLESFIFDTFHLADSHFCVMEVERNEEFSPLKNAEETKRDCLSTCRSALFAEHNRRLKAAGIDWIKDVLLHPSVSYEGEDLTKFKNADQPDYTGEKFVVLQDGREREFPEKKL